MTEIICTCLTGLFLIVSAIIQVQSGKNYKLIEYRLTELETHVKTHNNLNDRLLVVEQDLKYVKEKINKKPNSTGS